MGSDGPTSMVWLSGEESDNIGSAGEGGGNDKM